MDQINFNAWLDRTEHSSGTVSEQSAAQIHAVLDCSGCDDLGDASNLPPLWHWFAFPPSSLGSGLHEDGNMRISALIPPMGDSRRARVEGHLEFIRPIAVGALLERTTQVAKVS